MIYWKSFGSTFFPIKHTEYFDTACVVLVVKDFGKFYTPVLRLTTSAALATTTQLSHHSVSHKYVLCPSRPPKLHVVFAGPLTKGHKLSNLTHYTLSFKGRLPFSFCLFWGILPLPSDCVRVPDFIIFTSRMKLVSAITRSSEAGTFQCSLKRHFNFIGVFICIENAYLRFRIRGPSLNFCHCCC